MDRARRIFTHPPHPFGTLRMAYSPRVLIGGIFSYQGRRNKMAAIVPTAFGTVIPPSANCPAQSAYDILPRMLSNFV